MASETVANGYRSAGNSAAPATASSAEASKNDASHKPTVEEVVDEEDILHPPPSQAKAGAEASQGLSEKSAGKQRASEDSSDPSEPAPKPAARLDVTSEEAFPSLGAPKKAATGWPGKPTGPRINGSSTRVNGQAPSVSSVSSGTSTPATGAYTPASSMRASTAGVNLPGRHSDFIQFAPAELLPPNQLKTTRAQVIHDINKRSKAKIEMKAGGVGNTVMFVGTGPPEAVREALREVASKLGSKQTIKVPIPASVRPHIVGRGGATIQGISKRTGANVKLPQKRDDPSADDDDDTTIDVAIEGDAISCGLARREIEDIVNERTSTVNLRMKEIPPEFFPFLAGPRGAHLDSLHQGRAARVQIPHYYQWNDQAPTVPRSGQRPTFAPQPQHSISISGDRQHAMAIQAELERQVAQLQSQLSVAQTPIERGRHQFIAGTKGQSLHDFFEETGCALILPPPGDDSEELTIIGPVDKLDDAMNKIMDLATSMAMASVDVARQHAQAAADAQAHARAVTRYLQQRRAIEQLERAHNASIVCPSSHQPNAPTAWEVFAKDGKDTMRARAEIMNLISGHPPSRMRNVDVDPFYHQHLQQHHAPTIRRDSGVHLLFPAQEEPGLSPQVILVYEGPGSPSEYELPRQKPSAADAKEFERSLKLAEQQLFELLNAQDALASREVQANPKFHDKVRRFVDREQASLPPQQFPVQLFFGPPGGGAQQPKRGGNEFSVRGPGSAVDDLTAKIMAFLEQEELDEKERGYTTSFDFPSKFANFLIGKRGENINKLREEFDVDIQVSDGKVELKGPKAKCDACKASIMKSAIKWQDETTHVLKIKQQYHRDLIGAKGAQVNRLQDRYNVHINFPRSQRDNDDGNDAATDSGSVRNARHQNPDEVVIKGPRKGADEAREELLNLLQYTIDNSHLATVSVAQEQIPRLIGQGGREMDSLRISTGCQIDVPSARDASAAPNGRAEIKLKGSKKAVEEAKKLLEEKVKIFDDTITKTVDVDKKHHKALIGTGGANIRDIVVRCGGPSDARTLARTVRFPKPESPESTIRVEGSAAMVNKIIAELTSFADQRATQVTSTVAVDPSKHRQLIGRGGETRRNLEAQFSVSLDIPKQGTADDQVKVTGQPSDVEKAKAHITNLVKEQEGVTIDVPKPLHHYVAENGQLFRKLRNDHRVTVDHGGVQPPTKPTGAGAEAGTRRVNGGAMPLIIDDPGTATDQHSWEVIETHPGLPDGDFETIPWILRGPSAESAAKAQALIEKAIEQGKRPSQTGYLILPDPRSYRFVVGPGGSGVNGVRRKTGCQVKVPKGNEGGGAGEAIEVVGQKEEVERAKEMILALVREGESGNTSRRRS